MHLLKKDHYALGLQPNGIDLLIQIIDLEYGFRDSPLSIYILGYILEGWPQREIARETGIDYSKIRKTIRHARRILTNN